MTYHVGTRSFACLTHAMRYVRTLERLGARPRIIRADGSLAYDGRFHDAPSVDNSRRPGYLSSMNDTLPPEVVEALRTLARVFTAAADAGTKTAFNKIAEDQDAHKALDICGNFE